QFFDRGHVDHAVVQVAVEDGHVAGDEAAVGGDGVAAQRRGAGFGHVGTDVVEDLLFGLGHGDGGAADLVGEPRVGMHLGDDLRHGVQHRVGGVDHHVDAVAEDVQVGVGDQRGDLD